MNQPRRGVALPLALWIVTAATTAGVAVVASARVTVRAADNHASGIRARWAVEGCLARVRAALDRAMRSARDGPERDEVWRGLALATMIPATLCHTDLQPSGVRVDANRTDRSGLVRSFRSAGASDAEAEALASAVLDWRDPDDIRRPSGAESADYRRLQAWPPRNGAFRSDAELAWVVGLDRQSELHEMIGAHPDPISLLYASRPVLAALPGMSDGALVRFLEAREAGSGRLLDRWLPNLAGADRDRVLDVWPEFLDRVTLAPVAWNLILRSPPPAPIVEAAIRFERAGGTVVPVAWSVRLR